MKERIIFISLGWLLGFGSAYFLLRKKVEEEIQKEIDDFKSYYENRNPHKDSPSRKFMKVGGYVAEGFAKGLDEPLGNEEYLEILKKYDKLYNPYTYMEPTPEPLDMKERATLKPYVIDEDTYFENEMNYEQINLIYYEEDDTLCNEAEEILPDYEELIGSDSLDSFEGDVVYVCDERAGALYEVTRLHRSYTKDVLGYGIDN